MPSPLRRSIAELLLPLEMPSGLGGWRTTELLVSRFGAARSAAGAILAGAVETWLDPPWHDLQSRGTLVALHCAMAWTRAPASEAA